MSPILLLCSLLVVVEANFDSSGFLTQAQKDQLVTWADTATRGKWVLCYASTPDSTISGWSTSSFHSSCDDKGMSYGVVKFTGTGETFGGFTEEGWTSISTGRYRNDYQAFLFSLDSNLRWYRGGTAAHAIYQSSNRGPSWGNGHDLTFDNSGNRRYNYHYAYTSRPTNALHSNDGTGVYYWEGVQASIEIYTLQPRDTTFGLNFAGSSVLSDAQRSQLLAWDKETLGYDVEWTTCYKSSSVYYSSAQHAPFHNCDFKGRTFVVVRHRGYTFGGYMPISMDNTAAWSNDPRAYIFSLDQNVRFGNGTTFTYKVYTSNSNHMPFFGRSGSGNWDIALGYNNDASYRTTYLSTSGAYARPSGSLHAFDTGGKYTFGNDYGATVEVYHAGTVPFHDNVCSNGTQNDPLVALPPPVLAAPSIGNQNYVLSFELDRRFLDVQVVFGNKADNPCNFNSNTSSSGWTVSDGTADPVCGETITFTKNAQTMVAASGTGACEFTRGTSGSFEVFTQDVQIITTQDRTIQYQQGFRNQTYLERKYTHYSIVISVPTTVTVTSTTRNVTGNITVLQAITNLDVDVDATPNYQVGFTMLTSSQAPYKLTYNSFTSSADLANSISVASNSPACADTAETTPCVQSFVFSQLDITTTCPTKSSLNDALTITYDVGCKPSFAGNCLTPSPAQITVSFLLQSSEYCPQVEEISISATLDTYKDVSLSDANAWPDTAKSQQFVVGSATYGLINMEVAEDAATFATTKIRTITTTGHNNGVKVVYTAGTPVTGVLVEHGDTSNGGSANWALDHKQARFSIVWAHDVTAVLDPITDQAQSVTIQVVVDVTYTVASAGKSHMLQEWTNKNSRRETHVLSSQSRLNSATGTVSLAGTGGATPPSSSSSASGAMSSTTLAAVGAALVLLVVAGAYKVGQRQSAPTEKEQEEQTESIDMVVSQLRSSSSAHIATDTDEPSSSV